MSGVAADLFKIGILATGAHALLHRRRPIERGLLLTEEVRLERDHAGNGEEEVGIMRDEAGRGNNRVASGLEERGEGTAQLVRGHRSHGSLSLMTANRTDRFSRRCPALVDLANLPVPTELHQGRHNRRAR